MTREKRKIQLMKLTAWRTKLRVSNLSFCLDCGNNILTKLNCVRKSVQAADANLSTVTLNVFCAIVTRKKQGIVLQMLFLLISNDTLQFALLEEVGNNFQWKWQILSWGLYSDFGLPCYWSTTTICCLWNNKKSLCLHREITGIDDILNGRILQACLFLLWISKKNNSTWSAFNSQIMSWKKDTVWMKQTIEKQAVAAGSCSW